MSQVSTYSHASGISGLTFRTGQNNMNLALASSNSGASAPSSPVAGMLWWDTANDVLKVRNDANTAWIEVGYESIAANTFWGNKNGTAGKPAVMTVAEAWAMLGSPVTTGTEAATTSGTAFDFTSLPSHIRAIDILLNGVSLTGSDNILVQLGTSGGLLTTGYDSQSNVITDAGAANGSVGGSGYNIHVGGSGRAVKGIFSLRRVGASNIWVENHSVKLTNGLVGWGGGTVSLGGVLTQLRVTRNGTNTFNGGSLNIIYW